jgi:hypothetical protein
VPETARYVFDDEYRVQGQRVEFRLIYKGMVPAESDHNSRTKEKHAIRKEFHRQLSELWKQTPALRWQQTEQVHVYQTPHNLVSHPGPHKWQISNIPLGAPGRTFIDYVGEQYSRNGYRFVPLLRRIYGVTCSLDVLFLRRDNLGYPLIKTGGDLDNRLKVLFDGLRMPNNLEECGGQGPAENEDPFFCLLEDDNALISDVSITTDRLLIPQVQDEHMHEVQLVVTVRTKIIDAEGFLCELYR